MTISLPYTAEENHPASATGVMEDFNTLKAAIEGINVAQTNSDLFQAGMVAETDWTFTASINSANGKLKSTGATGGAAWLPGETSGFIRTFTTSATIAEILPGTLPEAGKFMAIAYELAQHGAEAEVKLHSGNQVASEAEAEEAANEPGTSTGRTQIRMVIVKNNAGVYEIKKQRDMRSWATKESPWYEVESLSSKLENESPSLASVRQVRSGVQMRGILKVKAGETLASGTTIGTVPKLSFLRPPSARGNVLVSTFSFITNTPTSALIEIEPTTGHVLFAAAGSLAEGHSLLLYNLSYPNN